MQRQEWLHGKWIRDECAKRTKIGGGTERVGIATLRMSGRGEPALQERCRRRERGEWKTDRDGENCNEPEHDAVRRRRAKAFGNTEWQRHRHERKEQKMHNCRKGRRQRTGHHMRVDVADEKKSLERHHCDRPHRRRAPDFRQDHLGKHWLNDE